MTIPDARLCGDWLSAYLELTSELEAKEQLHLWTGLSLISAGLRRRVYMDMKYGRVFPNLFVIIVAMSGRARKSTAADHGHDLLVEALPEINVMRDSMTSQGLIKSLNHKMQVIDGDKIKEELRSDVWIHADEVANLFSYDKQRAAQMTIFLTRTYGCPGLYEHTTVRDSKVKLFNLYPGLLGCTDPKNLKVFPEEASTGLTGRLIWLVEGERRKNEPGWRSGDNYKQQLLREYIIHDLRRISSMSGLMTAKPDAQQLYSKWYDELSKKDTNDPATDAFYHRCHTTALHLAMLLSISQDESMTISARQMQAAIALIEMQLPEVRRVLLWSGGSQFEQWRAKYIQFLKSQPKNVAMRKTLLKHMGVSVEDFEKITNTLTQDGTIVALPLKIRGEALIKLVE